MEAQRLAIIGSIGALWISLGGVIIIAAIHDAAIATTVVNALVTLALGGMGGSTLMHVASQFAQAKVGAAQAAAGTDPNAVGGQPA